MIYIKNNKPFSIKDDYMVSSNVSTKGKISRISNPIIRKNAAVIIRQRIYKGHSRNGSIKFPSFDDILTFAIPYSSYGIGDILHLSNFAVPRLIIGIHGETLLPIIQVLKENRDDIVVTDITDHFFIGYIKNKNLF